MSYCACKGNIIKEKKMPEGMMWHEYFNFSLLDTHTEKCAHTHTLVITGVVAVRGYEGNVLVMVLTAAYPVSLEPQAEYPRKA